MGHAREADPLKIEFEAQHVGTGPGEKHEFETMDYAPHGAGAVSARCSCKRWAQSLIGGGSIGVLQARHVAHVADEKAEADEARKRRAGGYAPPDRQRSTELKGVRGAGEVQRAVPPRRRSDGKFEVLYLHADHSRGVLFPYGYTPKAPAFVEEVPTDG